MARTDPRPPRPASDPPPASAPEPPVPAPTGGLAHRQAALVAALVAGAEPPPRFAAARIAAAREALLRKRAGEVARAWPLLAATCGPDWARRFADWAAGRPPRGALRDGRDLARALAAGPGLPGPAAEELARSEVIWRYGGDGSPRRRRLPAVRRCPGGLLVQVAGRVLRLVRTPSGGRPGS